MGLLRPTSVMRSSEVARSKRAKEVACANLRFEDEMFVKERASNLRSYFVSTVNSSWPATSCWAILVE
jgi:hypothetical protein